MRRTASALLVVAFALVTGSGLTAAEPPRTTPEDKGLALVTLTTLPDGWDGRTDLRPQLEVFGDASAHRYPDAVAPERDPGTPAKQVRGSVPKEALDEAITEIRALAEVDLGIPASADNKSGSQIIDVMPENPGEDVHLILYSPGNDEGLTDGHKAARERFADVYRELIDAFKAE